jgi:hypothetical protein
MSNFLIDEETDLLAAEFVLGSLDAEERSHAQAQLKTDPAFIAMVRIWERRLGELHLMVEPVEPDAKLWQRIKLIAMPAEPAATNEPAASPNAAAAAAVMPELPQPAEAEAAAPKPEGVAADEPTPVEASAAAEAPSPAPFAPPASLPPAPDLVMPTAEATPSPDARALEAIIKSESTPEPPPKALDEAAEVAGRPTARPTAWPREVAIDVARSRDRWRAFGVLMVLLVGGLAGLLAAWKFMPDQLPAGLRPAQLMMSIGIEAAPQAAPAQKPQPPASEFDE